MEVQAAKLDIALRIKLAFYNLLYNKHLKSEVHTLAWNILFRLISTLWKVITKVFRKHEPCQP